MGPLFGIRLIILFNQITRRPKCCHITCLQDTVSNKNVQLHDTRTQIFLVDALKIALVFYAPKRKERNTKFEGFMCSTLDDVKELDQSPSLFNMAEV